MTKPKILAADNPWQAAMEEACIINWCRFYENDPVQTLHSIVAQDMAFALDPLISSDAQALIDRGRKEALLEFGLDETGQPFELLGEDSLYLAEYCDETETFNVAKDIIQVLTKHGYIRAQGAYSYCFAKLVTDMLGETYSPSLQKWIAENATPV